MQMTLQAYRPEPLTNFADPREAQAFQAALEKVAAELGRTYPLIINGERVTTAETFASINPARPAQVVGHVASAGQAEFEAAMVAAQKAFETWSRTAPEARARILLRAAAKLRREKHYYSAWMVYEVGKTWVEADADTAEAIDFLEFYAREMFRLAGPQEVTNNPGEENMLQYIPLGVGAVIPPFNFALAITCGMTVSAAVTGNTVLLKPAIPAPVIAYKMMELLEESGMPAGVVNYIPSAGAEVGQLMVADIRTRFVSFTGSREVGCKIYEEAAKVRPGQKWLKRVIAEMGGKDAIVVDEGVDLDDAAAGIVASAFGFSGQKCSACSRVIAHEKVYDELLAKVVERTQKLVVGDPADPKTNVGPVAEKKYFEKIVSYLAVGKAEGRLVTGGEPVELEGGYYIAPTIYADVDPCSRISCEEIFGPIVAFHKAPDFKTAIAWANNTDYGLTGAVYSNNREHLEYARREFHVGNLYLNRKCTGALVGVHPFGGFNMSGTDSKAGGYDYLIQFMQGKSVAEKF
jgi:1-pyrroline-5-carboxylate dehydrogenase